MQLKLGGEVQFTQIQICDRGIWKIYAYVYCVLCTHFLSN